MQLLRKDVINTRKLLAEAVPLPAKRRHPFPAGCRKQMELQMDKMDY